MKVQAYGQTVERKKVIAVGILFLTSVAIMVFGAFIIVFSQLNNVNFMVLSAQIPGAVFGAVITFLGIRYFLAVKKLKTEVYKTTAKFSWSNFKKAK
jgi:hypothetical protein